jgi:hypothetical protein
VVFQVNALIEESCFAAGRGEIKLALDRAKEASTKERSLIRFSLCFQLLVTFSDLQRLYYGRIIKAIVIHQGFCGGDLDFSSQDHRQHFIRKFYFILKQ